MRGEITAIDGVAHVARVENEARGVERLGMAGALPGVWHVVAWKEVPLPAAVQTPKDLEAYLPEAARARDRSVGAVPFSCRSPGANSTTTS